MTQATRALADTPATSLRLVPELRAVHLARFAEQSHSELLYLRENFDLGSSPLPVGIRRVSLVRALVTLVTSRARTLELPEPLWMRFLLANVLLGLTWKTAGRLLRRPRSLVTYAMENNRLSALVAGRRHCSAWLARLVGHAVGAYSSLVIDRIAFASPSSEATYRSLPGFRPREAKTFLELPAAPRTTETTREARSPEVVFSGVLEARKGIDLLLQAWPRVEEVVPGARLTIAGPGPFADAVSTWVEERPQSRRFLGHLQRPALLESVASASVVVAPSQPEGRWREQIGLPVKEALAAGATVVTTDQTGLAPWLRAHGHRVVPVDIERAEFVERLTEQIIGALRAPATPCDIAADLPDIDGRLEADRWLHESESLSRRTVLINPLGGALGHYTDSLASTLEAAGADVDVRAFDEPSRCDGSKLRWLVRYVGVLLSVRRSLRGSVPTTAIVTWPVLGFLDLVILRVILGRKAESRLMLHDPVPLVHAVGYSRVSQLLGRLFSRRHRIVVHSTAARDALRSTGYQRPAEIVPLPVTPRPSTTTPEGSTPVVRVVGQYKGDRDLDVLREIGRSLESKAVLEIHGRRWPAVEGWSVTDEFVPEAELENLMATSDVVLIPYRRFFQSDIAVRCIEIGTPFIGPAESSLSELLPPASELLVTTEGLSTADRASEWITAIESAFARGPVDFQEQVSHVAAENAACWSDWLTGLEVAA